MATPRRTANPGVLRRHRLEQRADREPERGVVGGGGEAVEEPVERGVMDALAPLRDRTVDAVRTGADRAGCTAGSTESNTQRNQ